MTDRRRTTTTTALASALLLGGLWAASQAAATPASSPGPAPSAPPLTGLLDDTSHRPFKASQDGIQLKTRTESTVAVFDLVYPPHSHSGWHSHPGIVIAVVREGSVERTSGCRTETFEKGDAFTEVGPHHVSNPGDDPAVLAITRIYPTDATVSRIDEPAPRCR